MGPDILPDLNSPVRDVACPAPIRLREVETVFEALSRVRSESNSGHVVYFYVTDPDDRLVGVVPSRRLLLADPATLVGEVMVHPVFSVGQSQSFGCALALIAEQRLLALPVVDEVGHLTGVVDVSAATQRLFELERREAADELFQMVGVRTLRQRSKGFWRPLIDRFSWGLTGIGAGLLAAFIVKILDAALRRTVATAFFIPCVVMIAEGIAMQAVTMSLQSLHVTRQKNRRTVRDLRLGIIWGLVSASLFGALVATWLGLSTLALVVSGSLLTACTAGAVLGYAIPRLVHCWRLAHRIPSGPVVLALTCLVALSSYLALSAVLIR